MRISDWSSDVCSSDLATLFAQPGPERRHVTIRHRLKITALWLLGQTVADRGGQRSGEQGAIGTSETQVPDYQGADLFRGHRRSEERRVGKPGVSTCRDRWSRVI